MIRRGARHGCAAFASVLSTLVLLVPLADAANAADPLLDLVPYSVQTKAGAVQGTSADGVVSWKGIPFAKPPEGGFRWHAPEPVTPWSGTLIATSYADSCLQSGGLAPNPAGESEDCLYLNVHRPDTRASNLPVMVWLHGGAFVAGSGSLPIYNEGGLLTRDVVVVTVNYRLGRLGFFAHPALKERAANFGLLDQIAALEWVRDNAAAFGGDSSRVTIFGESAGGVSVNVLMASPLARGLFDRAISQSGLGREPSISRTHAEADGKRLGAELNATSAARLCALPAAKIAALPLDVFKGEAPIVDGRVLPAPVADVFAAGRQAPVPYLSGTTDLEFPNQFFSGRASNATQQRRQAALGHEAELIKAYGSDKLYRRHFVSDSLFTEPALALTLAHRQVAPAYRYRFAIASARDRRVYGGARHTTELAFVFDSATPSATGLSNAQRLADGIADAWVRFATTGNPNVRGSTAWPTAGSGGLLIFTNAGPIAKAVDPWKRRLAAVRATAPARRQAAAMAQASGS